MTPFSLIDDVALVTGGAINIGKGIVQSLLEAGARVAIGYRDHAEEAEALAREAGDQAFAVPLNVCSSHSVKDAIRATMTAFARLDLLVNNAGIFSLYPQSDLPTEEWDRIFQVNARGLFLCSKLAIPELSTRGGAIVNIASINGFHPGFGNTAHYDASKGAVVAYTRSLAAELAPKNIRVNAIAPGLVDSEELRDQFQDLAEAVERKTPTQTLTEARDVGNTTVFLASRAARQITGETIIVDGGYLLT